MPTLLEHLAYQGTGNRRRGRKGCLLEFREDDIDPGKGSKSFPELRVHGVQ